MVFVGLFMMPFYYGSRARKYWFDGFAWEDQLQ
jgi:hypothetical protein